MKNIFTLLFIILFSTFNSKKINAQRKCGFDILKSTIMQNNPEFGKILNKNQNALQQIADHNKKSRINTYNRNTATAIIIPIVFHIIVSQKQFQQIGYTAGIANRCDAQIAVLNRDFNRQNPDSIAIPNGWKPLYANVGIQFGLAHTDPNGNATPGYEIKIITDTGFRGSQNSYHDAKISRLGGLDAWDNTQYLNIWCINFLDLPGLLGITAPLSFIDGYTLTNQDEGVCILYNTLGKRSLPTDFYPFNLSDGNYFDEGKTLTHEIGHFFEIWHVWRDDDGFCPWQNHKYGLKDIPPQANPTQTNPTYIISNGTIYDLCQDSNTVLMQPYGIACLDYMDYTDDTGMHLFTPDQAAVMQSMVNITDSIEGENYSLTQHPKLLQYPTTTPQKITLFPNPAKDNFYISIKKINDELQKIAIYDMLGNSVLTEEITITQVGIYSFNVSHLATGMYIAKCYFDNELIIEKLIIQ